jgi:hypothetical protein
MKQLDKWRDAIVAPVLVNLVSAGVLFGLAFAFKPLVQRLLAPPEIAQYPLVCFAEPYSGSTPDQRLVDFYVVNLKDKSYTRVDLIGLLSVYNPEPDRPLSPDLNLDMSGDGRVVEALPDTEFNRGKGRLIVGVSSDRRSVSVRIDGIEPRAFMKVTVRYAGMLEVGPAIERMAKVLVPFKFDDLQDRCFRA